MKQLNISKLAQKALMAFGATAGEGLLAEPDLPIAHTTEADMRAKTESAHAKNMEYYAKAKAFRAAQKTLNQALKKAVLFAQVTRDNLKPKLGSQYSVKWNEVGFVNNTLRLPRTALNAMALVGLMELYLKAHPEAVLPGAVTPELAAEASTTLRTAISGVAHAKVVMREQKALRDEAIADLRQALMLLRRELSMLLEDNDPRWLTFGFNVPADVSVPQAPEGLKVEPGLPGQAMLSWGKPTNTDRFHVFQETVGVDAEPVRVATTSNTSKTLTQLTPGAQVKFYVTAVNAAGESLASRTVEMIVP